MLRLPVLPRLGDANHFIRLLDEYGYVHFIIKSLKINLVKSNIYSISTHRMPNMPRSRFVQPVVRKTLMLSKEHSNELFKNAMKQKSS